MKKCSHVFSSINRLCTEIPHSSLQGCWSGLSFTNEPACLHKRRKKTREVYMINGQSQQMNKWMNREAVSDGQTQNKTIE